MGLLEDMSIFIRIVDAGGIGKAAEQMGMANSAISRRLSELESRLGTTLINRTTRTYSLTEAGVRYYDRAVKVVDDVTELNGVMTASTTQLTGTINLAAPLSFGLAHLAPALDLFIKEHDQLKLNIDFSDRQVDVINEGIDLAFRIAESMEPSNLVARKITAINRTLCASPTYLERYGVPKIPQDLKHHQLLGYSIKGSSIGQLRDKKGNLYKINGQIKLIANNGIFLKDMAVAGHGISGEPRFITWEAIQSGALVPILTEYELLGSYAYAVYPKTRYITQRTRRLVDFLVDYFGETPYWDKVS